MKSKILDWADQHYRFLGYQLQQHQNPNKQLRKHQLVVPQILLKGVAAAKLMAHL